MRWTVPFRIFREPIIGDEERPVLLVRQMLQTDHRNFSDFEKLAGPDSPMASDDLQMGVDQDGDVETETSNAVGELSDLFVAMESRILTVRREGAAMWMRKEG